MRELIQGLADAQRHQTEAVGATVTIGDLPSLTADRLAIEQIFGNLFDNAIKYLDPAQPGRIEVTGREIGTRAEYAVRDSGRGIAPEDHARVFELFRRAGAQNRPGEGIGLAHVKALVRSLGGRIDLSSAPGVGTTFTVSLPKAGKTSSSGQKQGSGSCTRYAS
jgi:signal transduction histidine kinase